MTITKQTQPIHRYPAGTTKPCPTCEQGMVCYRERIPLGTASNGEVVLSAYRERLQCQTCPTCHGRGRIKVGGAA